ncbi:MAG: MoxR family ATPase [Mariniphaga sp.]|nr:MoxR family ATPase [Mariniphaga sp.]
MENQEYFEDRIGLKLLQEKVEEIKREMAKVIIGQEKMIELMIVALLADGHVLLEGVPGIAKTLTAKMLSKLISTNFSRIQFTPDLMPSDVTGTTVFNAGNSKFEFNAGPIFSNIILIDEINRAPAKTQSALFEVMEEKQVTVDGTTYQMEAPFLIFATQNPLEHEGTYRLPEAQLDRFLFKLVINYPSVTDEFLILKNAHLRQGGKEMEGVAPVIAAQQLVGFQKVIQQVHVEDHLLTYIAEIVNKTRNHASLYLGASPRASINILKASKAFAAIQGRDFVIPEDIKAVMIPILIHRIYLTPEKEMEGISEAQIISEIINSVSIPR